MEKFLVGAMVGGLCGALLVTNNYKMRTLVKKGQEEVQAKLDKLMDEKIEQVQDATEELKTEAKEKAEEVKTAVKEKAEEVKEKLTANEKKKSRSSRKKTDGE